MTRAVISDFGGVLTSPIMDGFRAYQEEAGLTTEDLGRAMRQAMEEHGGHPLFELEIGAISEQEFADRLQRHLDGRFDLARLREVYFEHLRPNGPMIDFMADLRRRGVRMALCTNNVREWEPLWRAKLPQIDEIFEVVVDSAIVGVRKPDPEILQLTVERLGGLEPEDCVLIDDLEINCESARALGMQAVRFADHEQAIPDVEELLVPEEK